MNPKFWIGDKVSCISGAGVAEDVFQIEHIRISKGIIKYTSDAIPNWATEGDLTIYKEPKKKVKIHERLSRNSDGLYRVFFCDDLMSIPMNTISTGRTFEVEND